MGSLQRENLAYLKTTLASGPNVMPEQLIKLKVSADENQAKIQQKAKSLQDIWAQQFEQAKAHIAAQSLLGHQFLEEKKDLQQNIATLESKISTLQLDLNELTVEKNKVDESIQIKEKEYLSLEQTCKDKQDKSDSESLSKLTQCKSENEETVNEINVNHKKEIDQLQLEASQVKEQIDKQTKENEQRIQEITNGNVTEIGLKTADMAKQNDNEIEKLNKIHELDNQENEKKLDEIQKEHIQMLLDQKNKYEKQITDADAVKKENDDLMEEHDKHLAALIQTYQTNDEENQKVWDELLKSEHGIASLFSKEDSEEGLGISFSKRKDNTEFMKKNDDIQSDNTHVSAKEKTSSHKKITKKSKSASSTHSNHNLHEKTEALNSQTF